MEQQNNDQKFRISGPTPHLLNQNLHIQKTPIEFVCVLKFERHSSLIYTDL